MKKIEPKRWLLQLVAGLLILSSFGISDAKAEDDYIGVSFQVFYDELAPYGDWVRDARYGYIWLPAVGYDFHPYGTNGHWAMTGYGNTWVSYYDWGWAPFHYGRWYFDDFYQSWAWIPGYDWGPAWVSWRTGGGYYGWAPMGPGLSVSVRVNIPSFHWVFLPSRRIYDHYGYRHYVHGGGKVKIINKTKIINNTVVYNNNTYVSGPSRREVERSTGRSVRVYDVNRASNPGRSSVSRNSVNVYQPDLRSARGRTVDSRPSRVSTPDQARTNRSARVNSSRNGNSNSRATQPSSRGSQGNSRVATPNTNRSVDRSAGSSRGQNSGFEMKPYSQERGRTTAPTNRNSRVQSSPNSGSRTTTRPQTQSAPRRQEVQRQSSPNRNSTVNRGSNSSGRSNSRTSPQVGRSSSSRTSPQVGRSSSSRTSPQVGRSSSSSRTSPQVGRTSSPTRSSGARTSPQVSRSSSSKSSGSRTSSSRSSSSRTSKSSSSSRGNTRNN